ncbi:MAG: Wzz/FepE/Etk N-terminal domain-containing protein, partial [Candidatus Cloacimonetes bacterium]|nr:Wzz/FepE/Etk N-terminal domain-containing protein [Candidatus Cloacimonadota bacterium]
MEEKKNIGVFEILNILAIRKKMIFWVTLVMSIAVVIFSLVVTQKWTSTAVVQPLTSSSGISLGGLSSSLLSSFAGGLSGGA